MKMKTLRCDRLSTDRLLPPSRLTEPCDRKCFIMKIFPYANKGQRTKILKIMGLGERSRTWCISKSAVSGGRL